jgi:hypothetical protein
LQVSVFFFCSSSESNTQYPLLSLLLPLSLPVLVCKSSSSYTHAQSKTTLYLVYCSKVCMTRQK